MSENINTDGEGVSTLNSIIHQQTFYCDDCHHKRVSWSGRLIEHIQNFKMVMLKGTVKFPAVWEDL